MNYDYQIRGEFEDLFYDLSSGDYGDLEKLRLGTEIIKYARDVLDGDLDDKEIFEEYKKLDNICKRLDDICKELDNIIENYV